MLCEMDTDRGVKLDDISFASTPNRRHWGIFIPQLVNYVRVVRLSFRSHALSPDFMIALNQCRTSIERAFVSWWKYPTLLADFLNMNRLSLTHLFLHRCAVDFFDLLSPYEFPALQVLRIHSAEVDAMLPILAWCIELQVLVFDGFVPTSDAVFHYEQTIGELALTTLAVVNAKPESPNDLIVLLGVLTTLETVDIDVTGENAIYSGSTASLLVRNPNLTALRIAFDHPFDKTLLSVIAEHGQSLQYLDICKCFVGGYNYGSGYPSVLPLVPLAAQLLELAISLPEDADSIAHYHELLCHCTNLQALMVDAYYLREGLEPLVTPCTSLTYLSIVNGFLDEEEFWSIWDNLPTLQLLRYVPGHENHDFAVLDVIRFVEKEVYRKYQHNVCADTPYWRQYRVAAGAAEHGW